MAKKKAKKIRKPTKKELLKMDKGIHRQTMLDMGLYNSHKPKVHKNKKAYSRKRKPKDDADDV